jgi:hypothetical protein
MSSFNRDNNLTRAETEQLAKLEEVVERGLGTYVEVRDSLSSIALAQLYRGSHPTFASYLVTRWGLAQPLKLHPAPAPSSTLAGSEPAELVPRLRWLLTQSAGSIADVAHQLETRGGQIDASARKMLERDVLFLEEEVSDLLALIRQPTDWDAEYGRLLDGEIPPLEDEED